MERTICRALAVLLTLAPAIACAADGLTCWFPPGWKSKGERARQICSALSDNAGMTVQPLIAKSYPEILKAFGEGDATLVYVGSFVQAVIKARGVGVALVQAVDGKEFYGSWMVLPDGEDPNAILESAPEKIAFTVGASSGESGAKAATRGRATIGVRNHGAAAGAVKAGKAEAAFVKNWWWEGNKDKFPGLVAHQIPGVSDRKNPDNVLTASIAVPEETRAKIVAAAMASAASFGATEMRSFDPSDLEFSLDLMKRGGVDPVGYVW